MDPLQLARAEVAYRKALKRSDLEAKDICSVFHDHVVPLTAQVGVEHDDWKHAALQPEGASIVGGGRVLKKVRGMGTVYDWRHTNWAPANGGTIKLQVFVQHIPVVRNMAGIADFVVLRNVLVAQGLMVQQATDRDGNVALYTPMNSLCFQARGANQFSTGTEHMHMTTGEEWSKKQLRASAWIINQASLVHGVTIQNGRLSGGSGVARVAKKGQVSHMAVSKAAGFNDRVDPGNRYDWEYVRHCVMYFRKHSHFEGA